MVSCDIPSCIHAAPSGGDVRLVGVSSSDHEGLVEMYVHRRGYGWSTLCTNDWDDMDAAVVCKQLGYHTGKSKYYRCVCMYFEVHNYSGGHKLCSWEFAMISFSMLSVF